MEGKNKVAIGSPIECTCFTCVIVVMISLASSDLIFFLFALDLRNVLLQTNLTSQSKPHDRSTSFTELGTFFFEYLTFCRFLLLSHAIRHSAFVTYSSATMQ